MQSAHVADEHAEHADRQEAVFVIRGVSTGSPTSDHFHKNYFNHETSNRIFKIE
jgi:hypothetical protein